MVGLVSALAVYASPTVPLTRDLVIGDNESEIMKMIGQLPKE